MSRNVLRPLSFIAILLFAVALLGAMGAKNDPSPSHPQVAVIDLKYVFDHFEAFQTLKADLDAQVARSETAVKERKQKIDDAVAELKKASSGTLDYDESKKSVMDMSAELKKQIDAYKAAFVREESGLYAKAFEKIRKEVADVAREGGIQLVIRTNPSEEMSGLDPEKVMKELNKPVVYNHENVDITTREIVRRLNSTDIASHSTQNLQLCDNDKPL